MSEPAAEAVLAHLELERLIALHATEDSAFRTALLEDPAAALDAVLQGPLPQDLEVQVVERRPGALLVVVPAEDGASELSEPELAGVAGGGGKGAGGGGMSLQDLMKLQNELKKLNLQHEMTTKVADKATQGVKTLFKNQ